MQKYHSNTQKIEKELHSSITLDGNLKTEPGGACKTNTVLKEKKEHLQPSRPLKRYEIDHDQLELFIS